jgi:glutamate synthase (NADPH/NADH) large chain
MARIVHEEGQTSSAGATCRVPTPDWPKPRAPIEPVMRQVFIGRGARLADQNAFERKLFVIRKRVEHEVARLPSKMASSSTCPRCRRAPWSTRACCWPIRSATYYLDLQDAHGVGAGAGAPAFLDQHLPDLGSGASRSA